MNGTPPFFSRLHSKYALALLFGILLTGCSPEKDIVKQGETLFNKTHIGKNNVMGCVACHSVAAGQQIVGPSLAGLKDRAAYMVEGKSAEAYIKQSIINPDAFIVEGFMPATMFSHYKTELSSEEIDALVAYLSQL